jgi:Ni,Fe-hydrogenase I cytochrome b subunit
MNTFLTAVGQTPLSQTLQTVAWMIPFIQSVHILALAMVFTSAAVVDLRILGVAGRGQPLQLMTARFLPWVAWGVGVLLATGLLLMIAEPRRAILNPYFQIKMAGLVLVGAMTWTISAAASGRIAPGIASKPVAALSLALWVVIIALGRWIAYGP